MKYQRVTTHLAETMSKLDVDKAMRDDYAKCILADPQILANIVKVIVPEFREYSIKDIIPCIGETIVSLTVPEKLCIKIESDGTEDVDIEDGKIVFSIEYEDIHMNIEKILIDRIGDIGKKLHTGRSRNDQVAVDMKLFTKDEVVKVQALLLDLLEVISSMAKENISTYMPGFTHLQKAQPVSFAHYILAYAEMFRRDYVRLSNAMSLADTSPLGSAALAGTTYPLDREFTASELGFTAPTWNSMDSVSDRDYLIEIMNAFSLIMVHLSRFCEEIIIFSSNDYGYIELSDSFSTGSSIMPQKKNPDAAELIRGKSGRVFGDLMALLTTMKGIPLAYNKDMQEDKENFFDALDTVKACLNVFIGMFHTLTVKKENMLLAASQGFINATDVADFLTEKGMSFRDAYKIVGSMVAYCIDNLSLIHI